MNEKRRRRYDAGFKRNTIALSEDPDRTAHSVEQSPGNVNGLIGNWKRQLSDNGG